MAETTAQVDPSALASFVGVGVFGGCTPVPPLEGAFWLAYRSPLDLSRVTEICCGITKTILYFGS